MIFHIIHRIVGRRLNLSRLNAQTKEMTIVITDLQYADDCDVLAHTAE